MQSHPVIRLNLILKFKIKNILNQMAATKRKWIYLVLWTVFKNLWTVEEIHSYQYQAYQL